MRRRPPVFRGPEKFPERSLLAGSLIRIFGRLDASTYLEAGRAAAFARE
jgi:hypothetical protein